MGEVTLSGLLVCRSDEEVAAVEAHLRAHIELTRAEPGCLSFDVVRTEDPWVWRVDERFDGPAAFAAHQQRVAAGEWGAATKTVERRYSVRGL
ncbi:putative quinol monooxygenase [Williamsia sterculiae]|uniref:Quinol monooxygenase YgiN n=1 Tax=Williamsia sterculiae TaxID=1344003 RepID=A0A1N7GIS3_9NOCA|nr:antibiotic biosynthesis monooxygenase [Williamsia sterculiae]SIS12491.1 Quinol monooxygenase YgiN [Williamsia sterculiae]